MPGTYILPDKCHYLLPQTHENVQPTIHKANRKQKVVLILALVPQTSALLVSERSVGGTGSTGSTRKNWYRQMKGATNQL